MISVIVPVYRVEEYLIQCVESICNQTYRDLEIILVDDGSTDKCPLICDECAKKDERIRVIHQANKGVSGARNIGLEHATGEYIAFIDGDDFVHPEMFERLLKKMKSENADLSICSYAKVDANGENIENTSPIKDELQSGYEILKKLPLEKGWYYVTVWNKLYKRELFDKLRFPEGKMHEDEMIIHKVLLDSKKVVTVAEKLYYYRRTKNSLMNAKVSVRRLDSVEAVYKRFCDYRELGYEELLYGTYVAARKAIEIMGNIQFETKADLKRKKEIKQMYRNILKNVKGKKSLKDYAIAWFPECYFGLKRVLGK